ncbi:hypothetical protein D3C76_1226990 [compost metagenome]
MSTIIFASLRADSKSCINAPLPTVTSSRILSTPDANFLLIIDEAIKGIEETVAVTSLKAYNFLSAIAISLLWLIKHSPISLTCSIA